MVLSDRRAPPVVTYGERYKVRYRPWKTVVKEQLYAFVAPSAPIKARDAA